jgi:hypothetical protein
MRGALIALIRRFLSKAREPVKQLTRAVGCITWFGAIHDIGAV